MVERSPERWEEPLEDGQIDPSNKSMTEKDLADDDLKKSKL